ncbi:hypothetical protein PAEPH01_1651 [Pancytospora epiphaga]|nr:hypothetical protein PAEPH01_1651 [Pancytospora epiphaga]
MSKTEGASALYASQYCGGLVMLRNISNLINLEKLSIWEFRIDENDMEGITNLTNLRELNIFGGENHGEKAFDNIGKLKNKLAVLKFENSVIIKKLLSLQIYKYYNL